MDIFVGLNRRPRNSHRQHDVVQRCTTFTLCTTVCGVLFFSRSFLLEPSEQERTISDVPTFAVQWKSTVVDAKPSTPDTQREQKAQVSSCQLAVNFIYSVSTQSLDFRDTTKPACFNKGKLQDLSSRRLSEARSAKIFSHLSSDLPSARKTATNRIGPHDGM